MVSFRLLGIVLTAAWFAGNATAQISGGGGGSAGAFTCAANVANPTAARSTGYAELIGDILITCTGGANVTPGSPVPTANITVALNNTIVTSRVFGNGLSEALLLIDEPGSTGASGAGTQLPQTLCSGGASGAAAGGCETYANVSATSTMASTCTAFGGGVCTSFGATPNVFQGVVNANQVVFNGVPILAPVTAAYARVFRITNVRVNAAQFQPGSFQGQAAILASISISNAVPLQNSVQTTAFLFDALQSTSVRNATNSADGSSINVLQCATTALQAGAVLRFTEKFANAYRTRISPDGSLSGAGTAAGSVITASAFDQNIPGAIYNGSESGFLLPVTGGTAGLSDFGTRLKATFLNVPSGVSIYVSTTNINPLGNNGANPSGGNNLTVLDTAVSSGNLAATASISLLAGLVTSETASAASGGALPLQAGTNTVGNVRVFGPLPVDGNGTATAVWEILLSRPDWFESAEFAVFYTQTGTPALTPPGTVALSMAPTYPTATGGAAIPRWMPPSTATPLISVSACPSVTVGLGSSVNPSSYGQAVTFTATVSGATGTVTFKDGSVPLGTAAIAGGTATLTIAGLGAGSHSITATAGAVTSSPVMQVVNKATTAAIVSTGGSATAGQGGTFTATVTSASGVPTGAVTFRNGATTLGVGILDVSGTARISNVSLPIGSYSITSAYGGDANFNASTSAAQGFSVNAISTTVSTPVLRSGMPAAGASLTFAATVSGDGPPLTGMVTFQDNGRTLGSSGMDGSGTATVTATLSAGTHSITASYGGDVMRSGSTSGPLALTIKGAPSVTLTSSANPADAAAAIVLTAAVAGAAGLPAPTGTVTFREGATVLGTGLVDTGKATLTLANGLATGEHAITAAYGGDANYDAATSATLTQRVNRVATGTTLVQGAGSAGFYLVAMIGSATNGNPTGSVRFEDATTGETLGSAAVANGRAVLPIAGTLPVGHSARGVYSGDERFAGSTSPGLPILGAVNGFSFGTTFVPDGIGSIFGAGLAGGTAAAEGASLPTTLGGVRVFFQVVEDGYAAGLYYVSPGQINFVVPGNVPIGPALLHVVTPDGIFGLEVTITRSGPALASANGSGSGPAAAQVIRMHRDGSQEGPVAVSSGMVPWGTEGDRLFLVLYGTGLRHATGPVSCTLNGTAVPTMYVGAHATYPGLDQVNLEIPAGMRGTVGVRCSAEGAMSNMVTLGVQ